MASRYSSEQKVKKALAQLDTAVQAWYAEHNPKNKDRYANATIMDDMECDIHVSRITLNSDPEGKCYIDIQSSKHHYGEH